MKASGHRVVQYVQIGNTLRTMLVTGSSTLVLASVLPHMLEFSVEIQVWDCASHNTLHKFSWPYVVHTCNTTNKSK